MQAIQFKRTNKPGGKPTADQIRQGEIAINTKDHVIFTKDKENKVVQISISPEEHARLNSKVDSNKQATDSAINTAKTQLDTKINQTKQSLESVIASNKTAIENTVSANQTAMTRKVEAADTNLQNQINSLGTRLDQSNAQADAKFIKKDTNTKTNGFVLSKAANYHDDANSRDLNYFGAFRTNSMDGLGDLLLNVPHSGGKAHGRGFTFQYGSNGSEVRTVGFNREGGLAFSHKVYHEGAKPTPGELGAYTKAETQSLITRTITFANPTNVSTGGYYRVASVTIPQGGYSAFIRLFGGRGYNKGSHSQAAYYDLNIRAGNGNPKGITVTVFSPISGALGAFTDPCWVNTNGDNYDIYVKCSQYVEKAVAQFGCVSGVNMVIHSSAAESTTKPSGAVDGQYVTMFNDMNTRGTLRFDDNTQAQYDIMSMSNAPDSANKKYLRKMRNYSAGTIWHETITSAAYTLATGSTDSNTVFQIGTDGTVYSNSYYPSRISGQFRGVSAGARNPNDLYSTGSLLWSYNNLNGAAPGMFPASNNANGILTFNCHQGDYGHQLGMSSNGHLYHRYWKGAWAKVLTTANLSPSDVGALPLTGGNINGNLSVSGSVAAANVSTGGAVTTNADFIRAKQGRYGLIHRQDGLRYYMLMTNADDQDGTWNNLRPFCLDLQNGRIEMNNGVTIDGELVSSGTIQDRTANNVYGIESMGNASTASKRYMRKMRSHASATVWHETVEDNVYRLATGNIDSAECLRIDNRGNVTAGTLTANNGSIEVAASGNVSRCVAVANNNTTAGVSRVQLEVHGNGNIDVATHDGATWRYPLKFFRDSANVRTGGNIIVDGEVQSYGAMRLKAVSGSTGDVWIKNWGNDESGRSRVMEIMDDKGYWFYCQRQKDNQILFNVNGVIGSNATKVGTSGAPFMLAEGNTLGNNMNNALLRGSIAGGSWSDWKNRASGLHINVSDSANSAYNVWKVQQPGSDNIAAMMVHRPGNDQNRTMVRVQSGNNGVFDFIGDGTLRLSKLAVGADSSFGGKVTINSDADVKGTYLTVMNGGRRHFRFLNGSGVADFYLYKDVGGDGVRLNNGADSGAEFVFKKEGDLHVPRNGSFNDVQVRSDGRLKINRQRVENALEKISVLDVCTYDKLADLGSDAVVGREIGIIAQSLQKVAPEAVTEREDSMLTISNSGVNALIVKGMQELMAEVAALREELKKKQ
ncbi:tail fiber domain-containing protein [Edwardsiella tarda]|uniref:Peptidase S74 domain-containing protein n=1 Tax=Edwardsiella tarda TaxID=636 RepID=A0A2A7U7L3_EDWTA|nr:tail fiber domain-containing protein [Edwardsiella tarda]PEH74289.1 hypothetical protein CRM76_01205 [Edwardsiella tarda]